MTVKRQLDDSTSDASPSILQEVRTHPKKQASVEKKTPYQEYMGRFNEMRKSYHAAVLIQGMKTSDGSDSDDDDDEDDEDTEERKAAYTTEQMNTLRYVFLTKNWMAKQDEIKRELLGDQYGHSISCFDTSFSYVVKNFVLYVFKPRFAKAKQWIEKYEMIFALTWFLDMYDIWMHDNEGDMEKMVKDLASMWKRVLKKTDAEIGIDSEFTRPGVVCFLEKFKTKIESTESEPAFRFDYE